MSFFASLIFLVHPLNSIAVNFIWKRTTLFSAMIIFIALIWFLKFHGKFYLNTERSKSPRENPGCKPGEIPSRTAALTGGDEYRGDAEGPCNRIFQRIASIMFLCVLLIIGILFKEEVCILPLAICLVFFFLLFDESNKGLSD